ncbi:hypothetical protein GH5_01342 [Leishmania sp. Ghana 2012 LV757]|uniref:hypothetical protein n=1 Tax=Leishmania sp. Ghana 2012 LV757 TaxID=2803181 RepID=UPI001B494FDD|nr:hypothetical protein GH5_01342 [Leishmania sp. Ghana 2012 LV757]
MRHRSCRLASAVAARVLLSPFGIGMSKRIALVGSDFSITALVVKENVPAGTPLLLAPDAAVLTCQGALDADVDGLVPPPAEMLEMLTRDTAQLDHVYLAYYLSLRCFTERKDWFAGQISRFEDRGSVCGEDAASLRIWERFARKYVTAPAPVFLAALQYVLQSCFRKPTTEASSSSALPPAALAVAPVVDVAVQSRNTANSALTATTAKVVKETYLHGDITGARQALLAKNGTYAYWVLTAITDIPIGSEIAVSSQSLF